MAQQATKPLALVLLPLNSVGVFCVMEAEPGSVCDLKEVALKVTGPMEVCVRTRAGNCPALKALTWDSGDWDSKPCSATGFPG